jgi:gluconate kinase
MADLDESVPMRVFWDGATPMVEWCHLGGRTFSEPFFEETIRRAFADPANAERPLTLLDELAADVAGRPTIAPSGFVFHMSRCGSTLVAQAFAALPQVLVLSEAEPIDAVLRAHEGRPGITDEQRIAWLRAVVAALAQPRGGAERHLVVKLDAWNAFQLDAIERAFPGVPWLFLVRDPVEVLVSHRRMPSWMMSMHNARSMLGYELAEALQIPRDEYHARVLGRIVDAMAAGGAGERTIDYTELPAAIGERIAPCFGIPLSGADRARLAAAVSRDAKVPTQQFVADTEAKQREADEVARGAAAQWLTEPYARLTARA